MLTFFMWHWSQFASIARYDPKYRKMAILPWNFSFGENLWDLVEPHNPVHGWKSPPLDPINLCMDGYHHHNYVMVGQSKRLNLVFLGDKGHLCWSLALKSSISVLLKQSAGLVLFLELERWFGTFPYSYSKNSQILEIYVKFNRG